MKQALVAIGVSRVPTLPLLKANQSVDSMCEWANSQQCDIAALTDGNNGRVTLQDIKAAIATYVKRGIYHQLIVYFAGHGFYNGGDFWLLSDAPEDGDAAVNVAASMEESKNSRIPHIVFISDACRTPPAGLFSRVRGGLIFPIALPSGNMQTDIDRFYPSLAGESAYEVEVSFFTASILKGLKGEESSVIRTLPKSRPPRYVVPADVLKTFVLRDVKSTVSGTDLSKRQVPEIRVETGLESEPPKYLSLVPKPPRPAPSTRAVSQSETPVGADSVLTSIATRHGQNGFLGIAAGRILSLPDLDERFDHAYEEALQIQAAPSAGTGFTVKGARIRRAVVGRGEVIVETGDASEWQHLRISPDSGGRFPRSLLVVFEGPPDTGTCLAVLEDFAGTVVVKQGRLTSVAYAPSSGTRHWLDYQGNKREVDERRAFVNAASRMGLFQIGSEDAEAIADYLRQMKSFDPTLGLLAAYAYARAGLPKQVKSIFNYMERDGEPVLFDVKMLARIGDRPEASAPFCPMLTEGWALLGPYGAESPILRAMSENLIPSLWTTLQSEGVSLAAEYIMRGEDV